MKANRWGQAFILLAGVWGLSSWGSAQPDLLAGGDVRKRQAGIRVGKPPGPSSIGERVRPSHPDPLPPSASPTPSVSPSPTVQQTPTTVTADPTIFPLPVPWVDKASAASTRLAGLNQNGQLSSLYTGLGRVAGEMATMEVTNRSNQPLTLQFVPGMVLEAPADSGAQPLMLEENFSLTLAPGESNKRNLVCYCLDYNVPPPEKGAQLPYTWSGRVSPYWADTVKVLVAGLNLDSNKGMHPVLPVLQHRRIVIQRAIWQQLGQVEGISSLQKDIVKDSNGLVTARTAAKLSRSIYGDIEKVLSDAKALR